MGGKSHKSVVDAFGAEAEKAFQFLVDELGFLGPEREDFLIPSVSYHIPEVQYEVRLDTQEFYVSTLVSLRRGGTRTSAELEGLVTGSGLHSGQHVFSSARTVAALRKAMVEQAAWVRKLHPILLAEGGEELITSVGRRFDA